MANAAATGSADPAYLEAEHPVSPHTFLTTTGDVLASSGEVVEEYTGADGRARVDLQFSCTRKDGGTAVTVWSTFVVPEKETSDA